MTYAGNPAISAEVQKRIRSTFEQTLDLASRGNRQEASLGCDFILQLDPRFRPAKTLRDRLQASEGAVEVEDLRNVLAGRPSEQEQKAEADALFGEGGKGSGAGGGVFDPLEDMELDDLEDELPELEAPQETTAPDAGDDATAMRTRWEELLAERRFDELLAQAQAPGSRVEEDPDLARLAATASERKEAASFVDRFVERARQNAREGDEEEARALLDKARSLDPTHPALAAAEAELEGGEAAAATPPPAAPGRVPGAGGGDAPDLSQADFSAPDLSEPDLPEEPEPFDAGELDDDFGSGDEEGDRRIAELLDEGQKAFDRGDHQSAIDAWSRIFLIDIDHGEASRRIEEARRLKSEQERKVEEAFHDAARALEEGDTDGAEEKLRKVLEMSPGHVAAREQLDRLAAGEAPPPPPDPQPAAAEPATEEGEAEEPLREEILVPPDPGSEPAAAEQEGEQAAQSTRTMVAKSAPASRRFLVLAGAVLAVVLVLGYLLYQNRDSFFPNAAETPAEGAVEDDPIARATRFHEAGKTAMAVNQLRRVPPSSARYEEAQALISQWQAAEQPAPPQPEESGDDGVRPADGGEGQGTLLARAEEAAAAGEYLRANDLLDQAAAAGPLPEGTLGLRSRVEAAVRPLQRYVELMAMGEYSRALPDLWRLHEERPGDADVRRLIADSYYNLALRSLQQGDAAAAVKHLEEAAGMQPGDPALERHLAFARTYAQRDKDLLYRIYVKYLPPR